MFGTCRAHAECWFLCSLGAVVTNSNSNNKQHNLVESTLEDVWCRLLCRSDTLSSRKEAISCNLTTINQPTPTVQQHCTLTPKHYIDSSDHISLLPQTLNYFIICCSLADRLSDRIVMTDPSYITSKHQTWYSTLHHYKVISHN